MPLGRDIARALAALWVSRALAVALNLLLVPLLFRRLPPDDLGAWLLMGQAGGIVALLDFGVTNVLTRRIAMAPIIQDAADLIASARPLYAGMAAVVGVGSALAGWWLLAGLPLDEAGVLRARLAWAVLSAGNAYTLYRGLWSAAATGTGQVAAVAVRGTVISLLVTLLQGAALALGGGVGALAALALAGSVVQGAMLTRLLAARAPQLASARGGRNPALLRGLLAASGRYWLTELGALALLRTDQLFLAGFGQLSQIPAYYAAYSILNNLALVSIAVAEAAGVFVSRLWRDHDPRLVHPLVLRSVRIGLALMLCGAGVMAVIGDSVIAVWVGPGRFVGRPVLLVFCAMLALFVQQSLLLGFSRATEHETYAPCFLAAGALNFGITWLLAGPLGLLGVALGTLAAQALTTSWFVPVSALRRLGVSWRTYGTEVLRPAVLVGALATGATLAAAHGLSDNLHRLVAGGLAGAAAMAAGGWLLILDAEMRRVIRHEVAAAVQRLRPRAA